VSTEVHPRLYIGSEDDCRPGTSSLAVVHACKSPCHQRFLSYRGNLPTTHPYYLVLRQEHDLVLNLIDPPVPLFKTESFTAFLDFATAVWNHQRALLVHCNHGESRAPSLALLFLAKRLKALPDTSFEAAALAFAPRCPDYRPGNGIRAFLTSHWQSL